MRNNRFLKALGMEDIETDLPETTETPEEKPTRNITQEPVHNEQGAADKEVPGTGATVPGSSEIKADELNNTNRPNQDITGEHPCGDENTESEVVTEDQTEEPPYEGQGDAGEQGAENPEPMDTNSGTEEPSEITPGEGDNEDFPEESEGADGDTVADDAEASENDEDTIIADVEVEEVEDVTEDEEEDAEDVLDDVEEDEEKEEDEEEVLDKAEEEAEELTEANEAWTIIMRSAVANGNVTPELKAGVEAHFVRMSKVLGDNVAGDIASVEAFSDDHDLYCEHVVASLEGIGDTLERIGERIVETGSRMFHVVDDLLTQKKTYGKIKQMADAALNRLASSDKTSSEIKTGHQTRELSIAGNLTSNLVKDVTMHVKSMEGIFNNYIPNVVGNIDKIIEVVKSVKGHSMKEMDELVKPLKDVPLASSYLRPEWANGKGFMGCIALRGGEGNVAQNGSFYRYTRLRLKAGAPTWTSIEDVPQRTKLTVSKADAQKALQAIRQHCANMIACHGAVIALQKKTRDKETSLKNALRNNLQKHNRFHQMAFMLANNEIGYYLRPARKAIYRDVRVLRGIVSFLNRF